ncbi:MAG: DUF3536 domain-containing protein [Pseudomonadota bacterium]
MERYICIHGHFYQPPRENPWLEAVELQDSAHPYHDWNERITAECYATNGTSRILDEEGRILQVVNNYGKISFNFGPTLLAWLQRHAADVYANILEADRESQKLFSGHGSGLAQAYNHMILPLANRRDKTTQIIWGLRDFEHRFGRKPEGMWLPETAVDLETLDILAEQGIRFTILAPRQAKRIRPIGQGKWKDVKGERIDPTMPYLQRLPSSREIALFFYDGPISRAVAFEGLLSKGESFARRLLGGFSGARQRPQIVHIATDGESYGHHHRYGDMALAYALHYIQSNGLARSTNYGEYLEKYPPSHEVEIFENSSWSCIHGIERWRGDCGCNSGGRPDWNQAWRAALRESLNWLRDTLAPPFEEKARPFLKDPWAAREEYIRVVLDRSPENVEDFFRGHATRELNEEEKVTVLKLLELQRHAMLMYTSCGWFFDELSGIETVQVIQYAGRALQLAQSIFGRDYESRFLELLEKAKSNIPEHGDGRQIFEKFVRPAAVDLVKVGAHYAMSSLFEGDAAQAAISCFNADQEAYRTAVTGKAKLTIGRVRVTSEITRESKRLCFGVMHWGDHNLSGCAKDCPEGDLPEEVTREIFEAFARAEFPWTLQLLEQHLGPSLYSIRSLFRDEQRKILGLILETVVSDVQGIYSRLYEGHAPLLRFLRDLGIPAPRDLYAPAESFLNASLRRSFDEKEIKPELIRGILDTARVEGVTLDAVSLEMVIRKRLEQMAEALLEQPGELPRLESLNNAVALFTALPFEVNKRKIQNIYYEILLKVYPDLRAKAEQGDEGLKAWVHHFRELGEGLLIRLD